MRAAKAVPGGARPTAAPQGSQIGIGQISPLAAQLATEPGYASAYGPFLPRPPATFTEGAFGPFSPILPVPVDAPPPGGELAGPRRFEYPVGYNLPSIPGLDGFKLASFATLATLSNTYSIARTCIERRKYDIAGLDWDIVPTKEASKAYQGDRDQMREFGERRAKAVKFFRQPDPNYASFQSMMKAALEEIFVFDALSILLKPKRGRGLGKGILGSDLDCLQLIDGPTIKPLLALDGGTPRPPAPAYEQYLYGVPRSETIAMADDADIAAAGMGTYRLGKFTADQLLYLPTTPRPFTPYGFSAVEMALLVIMTGLQKQAFQLDYFNQGTVPAVYISPGDPSITPNQVRELQDALNAVAGDAAFHHKIIVLPPGAKVMPQRDAQLADQFDEIIMSEVAMVFDVDPMSLGIVPKVSTAVSPFAAREMAQASKTVHERTSTRPLLKFWCDIFNSILHRVLGQDDMRFTFAGLDEAQDQAAMTDLLVKQVQNGMISIDEAREELQRTPWGLDETSGPLVFTQAGPVPMTWMRGMLPALAQGTQPGEQPQPPGQAVDTRPAGVHHPPSSRPTGIHNPRQGLPAGPQMRTGVPSSLSGAPSVSDTPAHAAARGHQGSPAKAVEAELSALARHLRKGRDIATWVPRHLPAVVMAVVAEDLTKGIGIDDAVREGARIALPREAYEWAEDAVKAASRQWPGWQKDQQLQQAYEQKVRAAFTQAGVQARTLIRQWLSGALAVTAAQLARMILALFAKLLLAVLTELWREAWHMGRNAAHAVLADAEADWDGWEPGTPGSATDLDGLEEWIASHGRQGVEWIEDTAADELAAYLDEAARSGAAPDVIAGGIAEVLDADGRAGMIAESELERAQGAAAEQVFRAAGVAFKEWLTADDSKVCAKCRANAAEGPIPFDEPFSDGSYFTPGHPRCRCAVAGVWHPDAEKTARRSGLNGQEYWPAGSYPHGPAMGGGGPQHTAHDDGTERYVPGGVPGMTAGGAPPRWDAGETAAVAGDGDGGGRAGGSRGGGTVLAPYRDRSGETHASSPEDADDADWPEHRDAPPRPGRDWPAPYMDGYWPAGGHGTGQAPVTSIGATDRGRPPNPAGKSASDFNDANPVDAEHVYLQLARNFPADAIAWVRRARWTGPQWVPWDRVDTDDEDKWAASRQPGKVDEFAAQISEHHGHVAPSVLVQEPGTNRAFIVDGHHRALARRKLGQRVLAYVGNIDPADRQAALETHDRQIHSGADPRNKSVQAGDLVAAGIAVRAADTGRILMLQRAFDEDDGAGGRWEFPGGKLEPGEDAFTAARREWEEETGVKLPDGDLSGIWNAGNGRYRGFVLTVPSEDAVDILGPRDDVDNPDDPDGDLVEALAWWDPAQLKDNPAVRDELAEDHKLVRRALKSAETPMLEATPHILGPHGLWHTPSKKVPVKQKLPNYIEHIAAALMRDQGLDESTAIAYAVNAVKRWARGDLRWGHGKVSPEVVAASRRALAEWEKLRATHAG